MVKKTLCTLCGFGCELGIVFDDFGIKGVEYLKDTPNQGRLCPRGSASALYLNHPKRLCVPVIDGKYSDWSVIKNEFQSILSEPDSVGVTIERNLTIEEESAILGFCNRYKIKNIASTYFEPENLLNNLVKEESPSTLEDIERAEIIVVLGDLFNYAPMISKNLINWKLGDRKHRLIVIDSTRTHTSYFATDFLMVKPGTDAVLLLRLAGEKLSGINFQDITGIPDVMVDNIAKDFKLAQNGLIICAMPFAHSYEPQLIYESVRRFSIESKKNILPIFEFIHKNHLKPLGSILDLIKNKKVKYLINFGELFPFYYPQFMRELSGIKIFTTSTLRLKESVQLPFALNMEKSGSILTTFGKRKINSEIPPPSGAKNINELFKILDVEVVDAREEAMDFKIDIKDCVKRIADRIQSKELRLFGEKNAFYYLGLLDNPVLRLNPVDASELGIRQDDPATIESKMGKAKIQVKITNEVPQGAVFTQPETPEVRGVFEYEIVGGFVNFIPTEVKVWQGE